MYKRQAPDTVIASAEAVDMVQVMVRQPVKDIRDRKLVPERRDQALKADRCLYTEDCRREALHAGTLRKS